LREDAVNCDAPNKWYINTETNTKSRHDAMPMRFISQEGTVDCKAENKCNNESQIYNKDNGEEQGNRRCVWGMRVTDDAVMG